MDVEGIDLDVLAVGGRDPTSVKASILDACERAYWDRSSEPDLVTFMEEGVEFLFDLSSDRERTVAAIGRPNPPAEDRDAAYQRGYPLTKTIAGRRVDRGHFIPYTAGGGFGPNLFVQDRALNRGWSQEGRDYRALERRAVAAGGQALMLAFPIYIDATDVPGFIQLGLITPDGVQAQVFRNRFDELALRGKERLSVELAGATNSQIGELGEETVSVILEDEFDASLIAMGDPGLPRTGGRQDLDLVAIVDGELIAFEVKSRYLARGAGKVTRTGNLLRPRLRHSGSNPRQASQPYLAERIDGIIDVKGDFAGIEVRIVVVDFVAMLVQFFTVDDHGRQLSPSGPPFPCDGAATTALDRILDHRGYL